MKNTLKEFLRDESGAASMDETVVLGGTAWMLIALVMDVGAATVNLSDKISNELEYNAVLNDILEGYGPGSQKVRGDESDN